MDFDTVQTGDSPKLTALKTVLDMVSSNYWDTEFADQVAQDAAESAGVDYTEVREELTKATHEVFAFVREMVLRQRVTEKLIRCHEHSHEVGGLRQTFSNADERRIAGLIVKATLAKCEVSATVPSMSQYWLTNLGYNILTGKVRNLPE